VVSADARGVDDPGALLLNIASVPRLSVWLTWADGENSVEASASSCKGLEPRPSAMLEWYRSLQSVDKKKV